MDIIRAIHARRSLRTIKHYIRHGSDVNYVDRFNYSCLVLAIVKGRIGVAVALIKAGADPNERVFADDEMPDTRPLYVAIMARNKYLVNKLIDAGADLVRHNALSIHVAISTLEIPMIDLLIKRGASLASYDENNDSPIDCCINMLRDDWNDKDQCSCVLSHMLEKGAKIELARFFPDVPILAFRYGTLEILFALLEQGLDVNLSDTSRLWMIVVSCLSNDDKCIIRYMIEYERLPINFANISGTTPLHVAAQFSNLSIVKVLIKSGANVDCVNKWGDSPLHDSTYNYKYENVFDYLLNRTSTANIRGLFDRLLSGRNVGVMMKYCLKFVKLMTFRNCSMMIPDFYSFFINNRHWVVKEYHDQCMRDIIFAKNNYIMDQIRYYELIMIDKFDRKALNVDLINVVDCQRIIQLLPVYGPVLVKNFTRAVKFQNLMSNSRSTLAKILPQCIFNNCIIFETILRSLKTADHRRLADI
ncbi:hypothetical protein QAD02_018130 [Eretmocerus hayati]|uniref:Uncharacterized protein n=1 Tax=Eretmocerus hayati TaxID=131215 RepID=A0ACC2PGZ1_9HYME|nr:hypothetical protein QAD02_018130 [Eretmocerus hayati]